jgi:hypothetical protein
MKILALALSRSLATLALAVALVLALATSAPCTSKDLSVFKEVETSVKQCAVATGLSLQLPPRSALQKQQKHQLCNSKACLAMLGAVDDLSLPRCDVTFNKQNVTLQTSLDRFASLCDDESGSAPSPMKKKKSSSSSSGSSSGSSDKPHRQKSSAAVGVVGGYSASGMAVVTVATLALQLAQSLA